MKRLKTILLAVIFVTTLTAMLPLRASAQGRWFGRRPHRRAVVVYGAIKAGRTWFIGPGRTTRPTHIEATTIQIAITRRTTRPVIPTRIRTTLLIDTDTTTPVTDVTSESGSGSVGFEQQV